MLDCLSGWVDGEPELKKSLKKVITDHFMKKVENFTIYTLKISNDKLFTKTQTPHTPEFFGACKEMKLSKDFAKQLNRERYGSDDTTDYNWDFEKFCKEICEAEITLTQNEISPDISNGTYQKRWVGELAKKWKNFVAEQAQIEAK